jgi:hypothetical protein
MDISGKHNVSQQPYNGVLSKGISFSASALKTQDGRFACGLENHHVYTQQVLFALLFITRHVVSRFITTLLP